MLVKSVAKAVNGLITLYTEWCGIKAIRYDLVSFWYFSQSTLNDCCSAPLEELIVCHVNVSRVCVLFFLLIQ